MRHKKDIFELISTNLKKCTYDLKLTEFPNLNRISIKTPTPITFNIKDDHISIEFQNDITKQSSYDDIDVWIESIIDVLDQLQLAYNAYNNLLKGKLFDVHKRIKIINTAIS